MEKQIKIALVTGGSRGLGKSMALHLAQSGVDVILTYNTKKAEAEAVAEEIRQMGRKAAVLQLDMANLRAFDAFIEQVAAQLRLEFGRDTFNILVNNAAIRSNPQMKSFLSNAAALGRVGEADDIGGVVALLCSEQAGWINGQRIEASGGINL